MGRVQAECEKVQALVQSKSLLVQARVLSSDFRQEDRCGQGASNMVESAGTGFKSDSRVQEKQREVQAYHVLSSQRL